MSEHTKFWPEVSGLQRKDVEIEYEGSKYLGHLVAPPSEIGPRPLVLVIHNYQGLKFFDVDVSEYLARLGYVGLAIDMYGELVPAEERLFPEDSSKVAGFQKRCFDAMVRLDSDYQFFRGLLDCWIDAGLKDASVDSSLAPAAVGYCFGGMAVLEGVRGGSNLGGVVSFHGLLQTGEDPNPGHSGAHRPDIKVCDNHYNTGTVVLIENGAEDHLVPDDSKARFYNEMDEAGVDWSFHHHAKTPHGFALPRSLGPPGRLHEAADRRSTQNMLSLFKEIFPGVAQNTVSHNAAGTKIPG